MDVKDEQPTGKQCPVCVRHSPVDVPRCLYCGYKFKLNRSTPLPVGTRLARSWFLLCGLLLVGVLAYFGAAGDDLPLEYVAAFGLAVLLWPVPWLVAVDRGHPNASAIGVLTFLFGLTVLGWGIALVWANTNTSKQD